MDVLLRPTNGMFSFCSSRLQHCSIYSCPALDYDQCQCSSAWIWNASRILLDLSKMGIPGLVLWTRISTQDCQAYSFCRKMLRVRLSPVTTMYADTSIKVYNTFWSCLQCPQRTSCTSLFGHGSELRKALCNFIGACLMASVHEDLFRGANLLAACRSRYDGIYRRDRGPGSS